MKEKTGRPDLSIIVPIYKVEKFLVSSVESMLAQTHRNMEIILVDDGSPDRCGEICDGFAAKDPRVRVIHQENAGAGEARNAGMDIARGEYLYFADPDDLLDPALAADNLALAREYDADIVEFGHRSVCVDGEGRQLDKPVDMPVPNLSGPYTREEFWRNYPEEYRNLESVWVRFFRTELIKSAGIRARPYLRMEDSTFLYDVYALPFGTIVYNPRRYYLYRRRPASANNVIRHQMLEDTCAALEHYKKVVQEAAPGHRYDRLIAGKYCDCATWHASDLVLQSPLPRREVVDILRGYLEQPGFQWAFRAAGRQTGKKFSRRVALWLLAHRQYGLYYWMRKALKKT